MGSGPLVLSLFALGVLVAGHPAHGNHGYLHVRDLASPAVNESVSTQEVVVWINKAGEPICTITENAPVATEVGLPPASLPPSPPPPPALPPAAKFIEQEPEYATTTTRMSSQSTVVMTVWPGPASPGTSVPQAPAAQANAAPLLAPAGAAPVPVMVEGQKTPPYTPSPPVSEAPQGNIGNVVPVLGKPMGAKPNPGGNGDDNSGPGRSPPPFSLKLPGVSYAPYLANGGCKSRDDIQKDLQQIKGLYSVVRTYGTDCDQVNNIYAAAKPMGTKLFLGIWDLASVSDEANMIISAMKGDWDMVHTVSVGNELVNNRQASAQDVVSAIGSARSILRAAGYKGPVVTVDTFTAAEANPQLCEASDYCAVNAHPFFDGTITADQSGPWLEKTVSKIKSSISSPKEVIVTETGWPTQGMTNGVAVPSLSNQRTALSSISKSFASNPGNIILFSAFNDLWKQKTAATFNADQYWGIDGANSPCDG